ncbi:MAG: hypothetical protein JO205_10695 [Pseudolabrys sp.]|nr:hypothetical protein [Pseudolabrys sp.]MBV9261828.1 hypothetical protein [Pseudolabrys sp.]
MPTIKQDEIAGAAYAKAWRYVVDNPALTPDERDSAPHILRDHVLRLIAEGSRDPEAIASAAIGHLRQQEQVLQSKGRLAMGGH